MIFRAIEIVTRQQLQQFLSLCRDLVPSIRYFTIASYSNNEEGLTDYGEKFRYMHFLSSFSCPAQQFSGKFGDFLNPWFVYNCGMRPHRHIPLLEKKYIVVYWENDSTVFRFYRDGQWVGWLNLQHEPDNKTELDVSSEGELFEIPLLTILPDGEQGWQPINEAGIFYIWQCNADKLAQMEARVLEQGEFSPYKERPTGFMSAFRQGMQWEGLFRAMPKPEFSDLYEYYTIDGRILVQHTPPDDVECIRHPHVIKQCTGSTYNYSSFGEDKAYLLFGNKKIPFL